MSKEISKAKGDTGTGKEQKSDANANATPKYIRRGDQEAARIAAYNEEQERLRREREDRLTQKRKLDDEEAERRREREAKKQKLAEESRRKREEDEAIQERERRKKLGLPELPPTRAGSAEATPEGEGQKDEKEEDVPDEELTHKFREFNEPICLFGETHETRLRRYRRLMKRALAPRPKLSDGPIPTTLELVPEVQMKISSTIPRDMEGRRFLFRQLASFFNMVLAEWEEALARRELAVKQSLQGRQAYNAMVQSRDNLRPLFRKLEKGDMDNGMLEPIVEVVHKAQERRYVDANDAYLRLSIGKAYVPLAYSTNVVSCPGTNENQCMAHRCHHGWYPRTVRTRKITHQRPAGAYSERRDNSQVSAKYQAVFELRPGTMAAR